MSTWKGVIRVSTEQKINMAVAYKSMSQAALARAIGMTPSNFNQKIKRETFSRDELETIAGALGATYNAFFEFPDGTKI
jgi:transcriptional regulator with XRE-family HTH domain